MRSAPRGRAARSRPRPGRAGRCASRDARRAGPRGPPRRRRRAGAGSSSRSRWRRRATSALLVCSGRTGRSDGVTDAGPEADDRALAPLPSVSGREHQAAGGPAAARSGGRPRSRVAGADGCGGGDATSASPGPRRRRRPGHAPRRPGGRRARPARRDTHRVDNQAPALAGFDPLGCDPALTAAVRRGGGGGAAAPRTPGRGRRVAAGAGARAAADSHPPVLHTHDRYGHRIDEVEFHPSWHWLMRTAVGWGLHAIRPRARPRTATWRAGEATGGRLLGTGPGTSQPENDALRPVYRARREVLGRVVGVCRGGWRDACGQNQFP